MHIHIIIRIDDRCVALDIILASAPCERRQWRRTSWTERRFAEALDR